MNFEDEKPSVREPIIDIRNLSPNQSKLDVPTQSELDIPKQSSDLRHKQEATRADLATRLINILSTTIIASFVLVIGLMLISIFVDEKKTSSLDKTSALAKDLITVIFTAQIGLVGTALGFYFGSKGNSD